MSDVAIFTDGRIVTATCGSVKVWKWSGTWRVQRSLCVKCVYCVTVLVDGRIVTGDRYMKMKVWKETSPGSGVWKIEMTRTDHSDTLIGMTILADGRLATASMDKMVKVWG